MVERTKHPPRYIEIKFGKRGLDAAKARGGRTRYKLVGSDVEGLYMDVTPPPSSSKSKAPKERKTLFWRRSCQGKPGRVTIGHWPDVSLDYIKEKVTEYNGLRATGWTPEVESRRKAREMTLKAAFEVFLERHAETHKKPSSIAEDRRNFKNHLEELGKLKISEIRRTDVAKLHNEIKSKAGPTAANRVLALLRSIYNKLIDWEMLEGGNPCSRIKLFRERSRDRFLEEHEVGPFLRAVYDEQNEAGRDMVLLCLLTGARKGNVLAMRWDQLRLDSPTPVWLVPDTKSGEPQTVPLVTQAVEILKARRPAADDPGASDWVLPGDGDEGHITETKGLWRRIRKRAEKHGADAGVRVDDLRIHDLRRTMASWATAQGAPHAVVGQILGHISHRDVTFVYTRSSQETIRRVMQDVADALLEEHHKCSKLPYRRVTEAGQKIS